MLERLEKVSTILTEGEKLKDSYLKQEIDASIAACLTTDKEKLIDAYNLRNGVRDIEKYSYLWKAYGLEFPAQLRHIPVLRSIFDALVGQSIGRPFNHKISCSDTDSISYIFNQYRDNILEDINQFLLNKIKAATMMSQGKDPGEVSRAQQFLKEIEKKYTNGSFKSDIEKYAETMKDWMIQRFKVKSMGTEIINDLVTAGQAYYQVKVLQVGKKPLIRIINPLNFFYTKGSETKWIKACERGVYKERIPVTEAWTLFGHKLTEKDQKRFVENWGKYIVGSDIEILDYKFGTLGSKHHFTLQKGMEIPMIDVSYVEWKANTRVAVSGIEESEVEGVTAEQIVNRKKRWKYRLDRFEGVRIGEDMYAGMGRSKFVVRDPDDKSNVSLTFNGACYNDRNGEPYSLVLKTDSIAEKIDILHYHAENLLAISGTRAIQVNFADLPVWMGENPIQRIMKWLGMVKQGIAVVDLSQTGAGVGKFANTGEVDLSMSNSILSIFQMLEYLESTAYKVTGVSRQAVGNINQNDGKGTSQLAISGTEVVTAPLFALYDEIMEQLLTDMINACRIAYAEGLQGQLILGEAGQRIFSIKKGQFNLAHWNIHLNGDGTTQRDIENIKEIAHKLVDNQLIDAELSIDIVTLKSLSEIKERVKAAFASKKEDQAQLLTQELENFKAELDKAQKMIAQLQGKDLEIKQHELQLKEREIDADITMRNKELSQKTFIDSEEVDLERKRVDLEALQLSYGSTGNKEIRNN
jgi:hypothetical protein